MRYLCLIAVVVLASVTTTAAPVEAKGDLFIEIGDVPDNVAARPCQIVTERCGDLSTSDHWCVATAELSEQPRSVYTCEPFQRIITTVPTLDGQADLFRLVEVLPGVFAWFPAT